MNNNKTSNIYCENQKFSCNFTRTKFAYLLNFVIEFDKLGYAV